MGQRGKGRGSPGGSNVGLSKYEGNPISDTIFYILYPNTLQVFDLFLKDFNSPR